MKKDVTEQKEINVVNSHRGKKYYSLSNIKKQNARYNIIYGRRTNGKTYSVLNEILQCHSKTGKCGVYIRRFENDISPYNISQLFRTTIENGLVKKYYGDKYDNIIYSGKIFYLCKDNKKLDILCYAAALNTAEKTKGADRAECEIFCLDEFITRRYYLVNEMQKLKDIISTFARDRLENVKIYMLSNSVAQVSYYFDELNINDIVEHQKPNTIITTTNGYGTKIAIEYLADKNTDENAIDVFGVTDDETGRMILNGEWSIPDYPHPPDNYINDRILLSIFAEYGGQIIRTNFYNGYCVTNKDNINNVKRYAKIFYTTKEYNINNVIIINDLSVAPKIKMAFIKYRALNKCFFTTNAAGDIFNFAYGFNNE